MFAKIIEDSLRRHACHDAETNTYIFNKRDNLLASITNALKILNKSSIYYVIKLHPEDVDDVTLQHIKLTKLPVFITHENCDFRFQIRIIQTEVYNG